MTGTNAKIKRIYVGTTKVRPKSDLVLQKVLDFTTNSWGDFTMVATDTAGGGILINTTGQYCQGKIVQAGYPSGNGYVYKVINAKRFWGRIKFQNVNHKNGGISTGLWNNYPSGYSNTNACCYVNNNSFFLEIAGTAVSTKSVSISLDTFYYQDLKFDNGLYEATIYDSNMNVIQSITYQSTDTIMELSGFCFWGGTNGISNFRVYEYREAYDNN